MNPDTTISWAQFTEWIADPLVGATVAALAGLYVLGFCAVFARVGFHWSLGLLMAVPFVNVVLFAVLAFLPWPNGRELRNLRKLHNDVSRARERLGRAA